MHLKKKSTLFFIILVAFSLLVNSSHSLALPASPQEEKAENTEQNAETTSADPKSAATKDKPAPDDEKATKDEHNHQVIIRAPVDVFEQQQQDIKHYLAQDKITALQVGSDNYLTTINEHTTSVNKGVMVLIPDWQQTIATPNALNQLAKNIPQYGWTTITLHPPSKPKNYPSQALTFEERSTQNTEALTQYSEKLADIMRAVIEKAKSYPGVIMIVAEGSHAALILDICQQGLLDAPSAMVMLSSFMPTLAEGEKIAQQLAVSSYPILDLYLKRDNGLVIANAKMRKDSAKREMKVYYRQKQLNNQITGYYPKNTLAKEIISWLNAIGW